MYLIKMVKKQKKKFKTAFIKQDAKQIQEENKQLNQVNLILVFKYSIMIQVKNVLLICLQAKTLLMKRQLIHSMKY